MVSQSMRSVESFSLESCRALMVVERVGSAVQMRPTPAVPLARNL